MKLLRKFRAMFRKEKLDAEMSEEMRAHLELQAAENVKRGMSADEARYAAQRQFGSVEQIKERARDARGFVGLDQSLQDVRYAARTLRKNLGFTAVVALTLALCVGLNTVVFTFYNAVALKPLAVRAPAEMVRVVGADAGRTPDVFSYAKFEDIRARASSLTGFVASSPPQIMLATSPDTNAREQETVSVRLVSDSYFAALGVGPARGRAFGANDSAVAVLSYDFWSRRFHGDPAVLGQTLLVQNVPVTILGIAPENFPGTGLPAEIPNLWLPLTLQTALLPTVDWLHDDHARQWQILARLKPDATLAQASAELDVLAHAWPLENGHASHWLARPATFFQTDAGEFAAFQVVIVILMIAVALILLTGCVNVVNLLAARNAAREHELAVRLALGASRRRLIRQLCTESLLLGLLGGAGGLLFSAWACTAIQVWVLGFAAKIFGESLNPVFDLTPDWRVLAYTIGVSLVTGLFVGLWPALRATRGNLETALKQEASGLGSPARGPWSRRNFLLTLQVAASLVLLAGAGLLFRGAAHALTTDPGFETKHLFLISFNLRSVAATPGARAAVLREAVERVQALPEIASVARVSRPPLVGHAIGPLVGEDGVWTNGCVTNEVSENYFETLGLPLVAGRSFTRLEVENNDAVAVISESAARWFWPGQSPLGRQFSRPNFSTRTRGMPPLDRFTVIGVVKDARMTLLSKPDKVDVFFPKPPSDTSGSILVRSRVAPEAAYQAVYAAAGAVNASLRSQTAIFGFEQSPMQLQRMMAQAPATVASVLGVLALVLASVGVYGVVAFVVARRTREIGIHLALGAQKRNVVTMVLRQTLRPVVWGAGFGLAGAIALSVLLAKLLSNPEIPDLTYGAGAFPSATLIAVLGTLLAVILAAAFIPARRAAKVDPMVALRCE